MSRGLSKPGWFIVQRAVFDHDFFADQPMSEREAFLWLVANAAWRDTTHDIGKRTVQVPRGSMVTTLRSLTKSWGWGSDARVRKFLARLADNDMIKHRAIGQRSLSRTVIEVVNYETHQSAGQSVAAKPKPEPATEPIPAPRETDTHEDTATPREMLLEAMGLDPRGSTPSGRIMGNSADMMEARRWSEDLGLTLDEQIDVIRDVLANRDQGDIPTVFKFYEKPMQRRAGLKSAPKLAPITPNAGDKNGPRNRKKRADSRLADEIAAAATAR